MAIPLEILFPLLLIVVLLALGVPVLFSIGLGVIVLLQVTGSFDLLFFGNNLYSGLDQFALIAIPLFILTGDAVVESGTSEKLIEFADKVVGGFKSGVGSATILGCGLFASISGSNAADAAAIGRISHGSLKEYGYPGDYAGALIASGATTGILIPPSIAYILIGVTIGISASKLFLAAVIPGVLILLGILLSNVIINSRRDYEHGHEFASPAEIAKAAWQAREGLLIPIIILGGIYSGVFTPTESAAVAVAVTIAIGVLQRTITLGDYQMLFERSAVVNGTISPIIAVALALSQSLNSVGLPQLIVDLFASSTGSFYVAVLMMFVVLLVAGAVMETTPNILLLAPLLFPVAQEIGMSPVHFAVFLNSALGVGFITPPFGMNLYVMSGVTDESVLPIAKQIVPFLAVLMGLVLLIGFVPEISTVFTGA
jgi:tripartite ATP-independent transporter DctM subunit